MNNTNISGNFYKGSIIERLAVGETYSSVVTGTSNGSIYGTNIYTVDSHLGTAAVHAGILQNGETKNISIEILPGKASYAASIQNGVSSLSYGPWTKSYAFSRTIAQLMIIPDNLKYYDGPIGKTVSFMVTGAIQGDVYGTDIYTDDSNIATAAVHTGILRVGQTKNISLKILPGQSSYQASTKNGVASFSYGAWSRSYSFI